MADFKIDNGSLNIDTGTGSEVTWAGEKNARNNFRNYNYTEITGTTVDGKSFSLRGTSPKGESGHMSMTKINFDGKESELSRPMVVNALIGQDGKIMDIIGKRDVEELVNKGTVKSYAADTWAKSIKRQIDLKTTNDKTSSLEHSGDMKAALAQVNEPTTDFKSAFNTVPNKREDSNRGLS